MKNHDRFARCSRNGLPKIRDPFLWVPLIKILVDWGLFGVPRFSETTTYVMAAAIT